MGFLGILSKPTSSIDRGWSFAVLAAVSASLFSYFLVIYSFGILYVGLLETYTKSVESGNGTRNETNDSLSICSNKDGQNLSGATAWIYSLSVVFLGVFSPVASFLSTRLSNRIVAMTGGLLFGAGTSLTAALTSSPWQGILLYGVVGGLGSACIYAPLLSLLPLYFDKRLALASGVSGAAIFLGPTVGAPFSQFLMDRFGMNGIAVFYAVLGLIISSFSVLLRPFSQLKKTEGGKRDILFTFRVARRHPRVILWIFVIGVGYILPYVTSSHMIRHAECKLKVESTKASLLLTYFYLSSVIGSIVVGLLGRRLGRPIFIQMGLVICEGILAVCFPLYTSYNWLTFYSVTLGLANSNVAFIPLVASRIVGFELADQAVTLLAFITGIIVPCGPPLAGWMYDTFGNYRYSFVVLGSLTIIVAGIEVFLEAFLEVKKSRKTRTEQLQLSIKETSMNAAVFYETTL